MVLDLLVNNTQITQFNANLKTKITLDKDVFFKKNTYIHLLPLKTNWNSKAKIKSSYVHPKI